MAKNNQTRKSLQAKETWASLGRILREVMAYRGLVATAILATVLATWISILGPRELGKATTLLFQGIHAMVAGTGQVDYASIGQILVTVLLIYLASTVLNGVQGYVLATVSESVGYRIRQRMMAKVNRMPMAYFESQPIGEVLSRITNDVDSLSASLSQGASQLLTSVATMLGVGIIMFTLHPLLASLVILLVPVAVVMLRWIMGYSQQYFQSQQEALGRLNSQIEETYGGQRIVRAFNQQSQTLDQFDKINHSLYENSWKAQFFSGIMFPLVRFISSLGYVLVVSVGGYLVVLGQLNVGEIQAFIQYVNRFTRPIMQISQIVNLFQQMAAAGERVFEFLDEAEESQLEGETLDLREVQGQVAFDGLSFAYDPAEPVIHNFNSQIQAGQKVALVGPTGAGKSTMVKLLMRFYDVDQGAIRLDGENIQTYSRASYQKAMAMVLQDTWLFKGSIMENIRYGRLEASDAEVVAAAKSARIHRIIQSLPGGYDFQLNEETDNISQGEKQLLTIARAILADRPILILDEATSSVDTRTEGLIQEAMVTLMQGRTSFVIAHRLSTIKDSDLILYMEDGDVVEQGNHQDLMALDQRYANLYRSQFASQ